MAINSTSNRIGTSSNLETGGTYDLLLIKYNDGFPEGRLTFGIYDTPMKITGLQKVAQIFLKILMTTKGSDPFYPNRGTTFAGLVKGANILSDDATFRSEISSAVSSAAAQAVNITVSSTSDTASQLQSVEILGLDLSEDSLVLYLRLRTMAGDDASISLPFPSFGVE